MLVKLLLLAFQNLPTVCPVSTGNMSHDSKYDLIVMERQKALLEVNNDEINSECRQQTRHFYSLSQSCNAISRNSQ